MDRTLPINEEGVDAVLVSLENPVTRNLVRMAVAAARMHFMREPDQSDAGWKSELPLAPFDMAFFARVIAEAFKNDEAVRAILDGSSIAEATGWNV